MKDRWEKFCRINGISWHNVRIFPKTFMYFMGLWLKYWRKADWRFWKLFPLDISPLIERHETLMEKDNG